MDPRLRGDDSGCIYMQKPKIELTIEKLNSKGAGIARKDGLVYFIPWGVPGDTVLVQVELQHKKYAEARLLAILNPSKDRIKPPCSYFYECGGCQLQHLSYEATLLWKKVIVEDALKKIAQIKNPLVLPVLPSPKPFHYRNRIRLHQDEKGNLGFYKNQSHQLVAINECLIAEDELNRQLTHLKQNRVGDLELRIDQGSHFSQINSLQNEKLIQLVCHALEDSHAVIDLFCGNGNFTIPIAQNKIPVWGIEKEKALVDEGKKRSGELGLLNIEWILGTAIRGLKQLKHLAGKISMVVDPPRRGMAEVLPDIVYMAPQKIIYVSCDPATFARDTRDLCAKGYTLKKCQPLDMFPHTSQIEVVGIFTKN
ncbi:MAG: hypothetical protein A3G32_09525 [Deltaproteobacteria bacterium RIFCSPLOWO2_12_FULL_40_28]|nr:MAG: hypothetical protein A3C45_07795 [Deltaproteobacteria bacterium RIFCSPHIGHO2_02_FULL_40_28]OGQ20520.1 MAG: hypothetical protein A3E27_02585 [Deltaproteobacteria bacterium RIFCSPHIGHO2_12_FULL_40_32]OGQ41171.1 MAG: hypothetical protein A3I69_07820 [Deltaproteobacteria bacterium RIFCSPLOWO2_02_FULL_40_36]OGQ55133.1 MAG: hypothetical protein A3G32_09525 [Deltaproteobacteria bacterium RIFCSPLOWO2_12_FULL_40_28]